MLRTHRDIHGKWWQYLSTKRLLTQIQNSNKDRINFYDFENRDDPYVNGFLSSEKEWILERSDLGSDEQICFIAVNYKGHFLKTTIIKSREINENINVSLKLQLKFNEEIYAINEEYSMPSSQTKINEYKAGALKIEVLSPFRRLRLTYRGYLRNESTDQIVFARFRLHWYSLSNVFDHRYSFDSDFIARQLIKNDSKCNEVENRIEQFGNIKGCIEIENKCNEEVFLWGLRSKNYCENVQRAFRLIGASKDGYYFDIGLVRNHLNGLKYCYGLVRDERGIVDPITDLTIDEEYLLKIPGNEFDFKIETNKSQLKVKLCTEEHNYYREAFINECPSKCIYICDEFIEQLNKDGDNSLANQSICNYEPCIDLVITLSDVRGSNVNITGGKGASLVSLTNLCEKLSSRFRVPKGVIITTNAYKVFIEQNIHIKEKINDLEKLIWTKSPEWERNCRETQNWIQSEDVPENVKKEIESQLTALYDDSYSNINFAVRSSAIGEDSEEMSAAGQLTTVLGVKGIENIYKAVIKCWSSLFGFNYLEYKRSYGQLINDSMAVVLLEMVDCDTAGVLFTCDPLTGDERKILVTANYGLGESVVSASAEPDTIWMRVSVNSNDLRVKRKVEDIEKIEIGKKKKYIKMIEYGGDTVELDVEKSDVCCIDGEYLLNLGEVALMIHAYYGNPRDIEWGVKDGHIYLLQSRPITSLESYTEWELTHDLDSGFLRENIFFTRLHWNENFVGSCSPLAVTTTVKLIDNTLQAIVNKMKGYNKLEKSNFCPYNHRTLSTFYNLVFANLHEFFVKGDDLMERILYFGRDFTVEDVATLKSQNSENNGFLASLKFYKDFIAGIALSGIVVESAEKKHITTYYKSLKSTSVEQLYSDIAHKFLSNMFPIVFTHVLATATTMNLIMTILNILYSASENLEEVFDDYSRIQQSCTGLVSSEAPKMLRDIVETIEDKRLLTEISDEDLLTYLLSESNSASQKFNLFLEKHGHRGLREMDPYILQWSNEPLKLIQVLKANAAAAEVKENDAKPVGDLWSSLRCRPSFMQRAMLHILFPLLFRETRLRERSKSLLAYFIHQQRSALWTLANKLANEEGKLPEADLMFFLSLEEIGELIKGRNPLLVMKAKQKKRIHPKIDTHMFPDIVKDWQMLPINAEAKMNGEGTIKLRGIAITALSTKGKVCVAKTIDEAKNLKKGDVLITYTTDVGWSPYFTLVTAVVTEMGGLVSHGCVIAREIGLPCLIGVTNACELLKTGDTVLVDGHTGTVTKLDDEQ